MTFAEKLEMKNIANKLEKDADVGRLNELFGLALAEAEEIGRKKGIQECIDKMHEYYKEKGIDVDGLGFNPYQE